MPRNREYDEYDDDDDDDDDQEPEPRQQRPGPSRENAALRKANSRAKSATEENSVLRREIAFMKAGVDTDTPLGQLLFKGYDGELTKDAVVAFATQAGILKAPEAADPTKTPEAQQAATQQAQVNSLAQGTAPERRGEDAMKARLIQAHQQGGSPAMLAAAAEMGLLISSGE